MDLQTEFLLCRLPFRSMAQGGRELRAHRIIVATGAWLDHLVSLAQQVHANAVGLCVHQVFSRRIREDRDIACYTSLTDVNIVIVT